MTGYVGRGALSSGATRAAYSSNQEFYEALSSPDPAISAIAVKIFAKTLQEHPDPYAVINGHNVYDGYAPGRCSEIVLRYHKQFSPLHVAFAYAAEFLKEHEIPSPFKENPEWLSKSTIRHINKYRDLLKLDSWSIEEHPEIAETPGTIDLMSVMNPCHLVSCNPNNFEIVLKATKFDGWALGEANKAFQSDRAMLAAAFEQLPHSLLLWGSDSVKSDKPFIMSLMRIDLLAFSYCDASLKTDADILALKRELETTLART